MGLQIQLGLGVWFDIVFLGLVSMSTSNRLLGGLKILFPNFIKNHLEFFRKTKMVPNKSEFQSKMIPMSLFHRILVEMKGLHLKNKTTTIKTLLLIFLP